MRYLSIISGARGWVAAAFLVGLLAPACGKTGGASEISQRASEGTGANAAVKGSDLDQPVEALLAAVCEHDVPQYTCAECRYQIGVVEADDELFDPARGGALQTVTVGQRPLAGGELLNGEVRLNEARAVRLGPRAPGVVREIRVDVGATVAAGQVLFEVESTELLQARADLVKATAQETLAQAGATRERELYGKHISSRKDLEQAEAALKQAQAERGVVEGRLLALGVPAAQMDHPAQGRRTAPPSSLPVRAPFAGTVLERSLSLGALVQPGDRLLLLADTSSVWVITTLSERDFAALGAAGRRGEGAAEVTVSAYPGRSFPGRVTLVNGTLDETTRTGSARVVVDNPENLLRAGMFARVRLVTWGASGALVIPEEAVLEDEGRSFAFVKIRPPYFIRRPLTLGRAAGGWVEVTRGLSAGDVVVAKGAFLLKSDVLRSKMGAGCAD